MGSNRVTDFQIGTERLLNASERLTKLAAIVLSLTYLTGFLITALFLSRFGVKSYAVFRFHYFLAGFWCLVPATMLCVTTATLYALWTQWKVSPSRIRRQLFIWFIVLIVLDVLLHMVPWPFASGFVNPREFHWTQEFAAFVIGGAAVWLILESISRVWMSNQQLWAEARLAKNPQLGRLGFMACSQSQLRQQSYRCSSFMSLLLRIPSTANGQARSVEANRS